MKRAVLLALASTILIAGCSLPEEEASSGKQSSGKGGRSSSESAKKSNDPSVVGNWKIENMKQIKFAEEYGMFATVSLKVRNVSDDADTPWLAIRLTDKKGDLIAEYDCIGDEYEPGQGGTVRCSSLDDYAPFADWEIKNAL